MRSHVICRPVGGGLVMLGDVTSGQCSRPILALDVCLWVLLAGVRASGKAQGPGSAEDPQVRGRLDGRTLVNPG